MYKNLQITAFLGFLAIVLGAFGAHALKEKLSIQELQSYQTGVQYMMYHVIVLLVVNTAAIFSEKTKKRLTILFLLGIFCFSGSIFAITALGVSAKVIWFITPLGGLLLIAGWLYLFFYFLKKKST